MELTQKGEMVSRLHAKTNQIGKILSNLEKYNHLMKDADGRSPTTPSGGRAFVKFSPTSPRGPPPMDKYVGLTKENFDLKSVDRRASEQNCQSLKSKTVENDVPEASLHKSASN